MWLYRTLHQSECRPGGSYGALELKRVHCRCSVLSAMLFAVVAPPDRRHIADIPRFGDVTTAEMIVLRTLQME